MKAKIAPKPEIILLYQQEKIKNGDKLPEILEQMGIRWKEVTQQELCFTTGELAEYRRKEDGERQELRRFRRHRLWQWEESQENAWISCKCAQS